MKCPATVVLNARMALSAKLNRRQEESMENSYYEAFNCHLSMYPIGDVIFKIDTDMMSLTHPSKTSRT